MAQYCDNFQLSDSGCDRFQFTDTDNDSFEFWNGLRGPAGEPGPAGPPGPPGEAGTTPAFSIGTVSTLPAGSDATASITGTTDAPVLNLGIPKGDQGDVSQDEFDEVVDAIGEQTIEHKLIGNYTTGKYWNSQASTATLTSVSSYTAFNPISVTPGRNYSAYIRGGSSSKQYPLLFVNSSYTILEHSTRPGSASFNTYTGVVPAGAVYALITANTTNASTLMSIDYTETETALNSLPDVITKVTALGEGAMDMAGKTVAILGDSISTNGNYSPTNPFGNVPEIIIGDEDVGIELSAYATYYDIGTTVGGHEIVAADVGTEITFTPTVADVGKYVGVPDTYYASSRTVWWEVMQQALGFTPIPVCWSGASMSSHEGNSDAYKTSYAWHDAQIRKCGIRTPGTMTRTAPDVIIIYRGTNDFSHSPYDRLTADYFAPYNWEYPSTDALAGGGYGYKEAICLTVKKLRETYPSARILICTLNVFKRIHYSNFPTNNGYNSLPEFNAAIRECADFLGIDTIEFDKDGITFENMEVEQYILSDGGLTHPTDKGHKVMANRALRDFVAKCNSMA